MSVDNKTDEVVKPEVEGSANVEDDGTVVLIVKAEAFDKLKQIDNPFVKGLVKIGESALEFTPDQKQKVSFSYSKKGGFKKWVGDA